MAEVVTPPARIGRIPNLRRSFPQCTCKPPATTLPRYAAGDVVRMRGSRRSLVINYQGENAEWRGGLGWGKGVGGNKTINLISMLARLPFFDQWASTTTTARPIRVAHNNRGLCEGLKGAHRHPYKVVGDFATPIGGCDHRFSFKIKEKLKRAKINIELVVRAFLD
ncbi:hypothetical protein CRG98_024647 [Punica granatum]|uniref:Uncharacterized protein n=1 Tax=Punica granatum TaxID=22663 RepID=A0A2I0JFD4_PUNGR|nr:hypothetical protein CRG98_024647 [Punica granatum]